MNEFLKSIKDYFLSGGVDLVRGITIILAGFMIIRLFIRFLKRNLYKKKNVDKTLPNFIISLVNIALIGILVIYALVLLGVTPDSIVTIFSVFSLGVSLALQDTITSLANGIIIVVTKPFVEGEYVSFSGTEGTVVSISMFNTVLKTFDGMMVTIPNSTITSENVKNYSRLPTRRIDILIPVGYGTDISLLHSVIDGVLATQEKILSEPAPQLVLKDYGDSNLNYSLRVWVSTEIYWDIYFALTEKILLALREANISIDYNQYDVHIKDDSREEIIVKKEDKHDKQVRGW